MAKLYLSGRTSSPSRETEDVSSLEWRGTRDGAAFVEHSISAAIMEGRGYHITIGAFSTGITGGGAGTILDQDQPEGIISVPSGTSIRPVRISVQCHVPLLATDADEAEILVAVDRAAAWAADGTVTTETAFNLRTDNPRTTNCSAASAATANITNPTLGIELARAAVTGDVQGVAATTMWTPLDLVYEPLNPPVLVGPCAIYIYWGGTVAVPGFAQAQWVEYPTSMFV